MKLRKPRIHGNCVIELIYKPNIMESKILIALDKDSNKEYPFILDDNGKYTFGSEELDVNIKETKDGFTEIEINGIHYPIEVISNHQNAYELMINGVSYSFSVETPFSLKRKNTLPSLSGESSTIRLKSPMPGRILEVLVKTGDSVKVGDTLVILEAMKMQNAILASTKGIIKKVLVKDGDTTSKSDLLIELEKDV